MAVELLDRVGAVSRPAVLLNQKGTNGRFDQWLLAAVMLLGLVLRLRGFTSFSFEQDELYTIIEGHDLFAVELAPGIDARPLYYLLQHVLLDLLPVTHAGLRIVPLLFGMLGIWVTALIARRVFGPRAAIVAALLVAIAPWHLHASTYARYWSLLYLLAAVFYLNLWQAHQHNRPQHYLGAAAALIAGSATHPSFLFAAFSVSAGICLVKPNGSFGLRFPNAQALRLLWLPYLLFLIAAFTALRITNSGEALQNWSGRGAAASLRLIPAVIEWLGPATATAAFLGSVVALSSPGLPRRSWGAMALVGCSLTLFLLLIVSTRNDVYADYAFAMAPLVFVSAAGLLYLGYERLSRRSGIALTLGCAVLAASVFPSTASHLSSGTRFDYRPAFEHIRQSAPTIPMLTWPVIVARHYAPELDTRGLSMRVSYLDSTLVADQDIWLIASMTRYGMVVDDDGAVTQWIAKHCSLDFTHEKPRWDYRVYRVNVHRCRAGSETAAAALHSGADRR